MGDLVQVGRKVNAVDKAEDHEEGEGNERVQAPHDHHNKCREERGAEHHCRDSHTCTQTSASINTTAVSAGALCRGCKCSFSSLLAADGAVGVAAF